SANTAKTQRTGQIWSGTYSLQVNCIGTATITSGDNGTFTLESYNQGKAFLITGQDGTYAFNGSGSVLPTTCTTGGLNGTYAFNGNGFLVSSGAISGVADFSGMMQLNGSGTAASSWYISSGGSTQTVTASGTYAVNANCTATASMTDGSGNAYSLQFTVTSNAGNFVLGGSSPQMVF